MKRVRRTLKKYFVPHEENDHRPHILRARSVTFVLVVALAVEGMLWFGALQLAPRSRLFGIIVANALVDETNQSRVANGDAALAVSPILTVAAQEKANDMVANNYFAHTSPSGLSPWYWFEQVGYGFTYAGENLAVNFSDSQDVTNAWMNSPEHRANILNTDFTQIGMATATGTFEGHPAVYVVELFGAPAPATPPAEISVAFVHTAAAAGVKVAIAAKTSPDVPARAISQTSSSNETFAAVKGAATQVVAGASTTAASSTVTAPVLAPVVVAGESSGAVLPQTNPIQSAAANPRAIVNSVYLAVISIFALSLGINIFVKIRIQHPQIIFGGMLVILVAGLLIILNQHVLAGAAIL